MRTSYFTSFALASFLAVVQGIELRSADGLGATSAFQDQYAVDGLAQISDKLKKSPLINQKEIKTKEEKDQFRRVNKINKKEKGELTESERKMKEEQDDFNKKEYEEAKEEARVQKMMEDQKNKEFATQKWDSEVQKQKDLEQEDREKKLEENKKKNMIKFKKRVPKKDM